jgi:sec-independent protein translocase protein TatA
MSGQEIFVIIIVALLLFGAEKLPDIARTIGRGMRDFKKATDDIRRELETSTMDIRKDLNDVTDSLKRDVNDLQENITKDVNEVSDSIKNDMNDVTSSVRQDMNEVTDTIKSDAGAAADNLNNVGYYQDYGYYGNDNTYTPEEPPQSSNQGNDLHNGNYKEVND